MLVIRPQQMRVFEADVSRRFEDRAIAYIRTRFDDHGDIARRVRDGIRNAVLLGLTEDADLLRYLELRFSLGDDFDRGGRFPAIEAVFRSERYRPEVKLDLAVQLAMPGDEPDVESEPEDSRAPEQANAPEEAEEVVGFVLEPEPGADPNLPEPYDGDLPPDPSEAPPTPVPASLQTDPHYCW